MSYEWLSTTESNVSPNAGSFANYGYHSGVEDEQTSRSDPRTPTKNIIRSESPICPGAPTRKPKATALGYTIEESQAAMTAANPAMSSTMAGSSPTGSNDPISTNNLNTEDSPAAKTSTVQDDIMDLCDAYLGVQTTTAEASISGTATSSGIGSHQTNSFASSNQNFPTPNSNHDFQGESSAIESGTTNIAVQQDQDFLNSSTEPPEDLQMIDAEISNLLSQAMAEGFSGTDNNQPNDLTSMPVNEADATGEGTGAAVTQVITPPGAKVVSADDSVLVADQQRGRLAKYRVSDENWAPRKRTASVPPRCGDHYSYTANWPPQEPPRCEFGNRVDVFPPRDAPLHLHVQAYALRWGFWASSIKAPRIRQQVLDTVANKMKDAWVNAIGENYYLRPVARADDSDSRNDAEEKGKRGRKRAVSPSKMPAGFTSEGKDQLAVTNAEMSQHGLTMDMINKRVQEKDFEAGEEALDEILENLGRDNLVVKDWSRYGFGHGSVQGRNLLMYSLFVVLECRNERRKLNNLFARFKKEGQKRNTRARIESYQEREFQHMALASELRLAQQAEQSASSEDDADDDGEMTTEAIELRSDTEDDEGDEEDQDGSNDEQAEESSASNAQATITDKDLIFDIARSVLSANSEPAIYAVFGQRNLNPTSFGVDSGLRTGDDQTLIMVKATLGEILGDVTRLISLKEMAKRQPDPNEILKMQHDYRLSYQKLVLAREKLTKMTGLPVLNSSKYGPSPQSSKVKQSQSTPQTAQEAITQQKFMPAGIESPNHDTATMQNAALNPGLWPSTPAAINISMPPKEPLTSNVAPVVAQNALSASNVGQQMQSTPQPMVQDHQRVRDASQTPSLDSTEDVAAKKVYTAEEWQPWLNAECAKRGQPPYQGVISDWPQIRDIITRCGYSAIERNMLLRQYKSGFEDWLKRRASTQQLSVPAQSPALSTVTPSPRLQPTSLKSAPPGWPSDVEVVSCIPSSGVHANELLRKFQNRVGQFTNAFSNLLRRVAFVDQSYIVYPSENHAIAARHQSAAYAANSVPTSTASGAPSKRHHSASSLMDAFPIPASGRPQQILKLKLPQENTARLPPAQDETDFPEGYRSTDVNATRGFSFRHLPHSTLEQRTAIDDMIAEYIKKTVKGRKKSYYGTYVSFKDPTDQSGPPIAHGFWDFKDHTKPEGSEWFFNGEDVPADWIPKLGLDENMHSNDDGVDTDQQAAQHRGVYDPEHNRPVRLILNTNQGQQFQGYNRSGPSQQQYDTYPPAHDQRYMSGNSNQLYPGSDNAYFPQSIQSSQMTKNYGHVQGHKQLLIHNSLDGNNDEDDDLRSARPGSSTTRKRGTKRSASAAGNKGGKAVKRRKKDVNGDDESDEDYVPGEDD